MQRTRVLPLLLAILLVLALPFEQVLCACASMGAGPARASGAGTSCHAACCARAAAAHGSPRGPAAPAPRACTCQHLSVGELPMVGPATTAGQQAAFVVPVPVHDGGESAALAGEAIPPPDVGGPPLAAAVGAHGLRAPPVPA